MQNNKRDFQKLDKAKFVDFGNAREQEQAETMQESEKSGECPFCIENLKKYHKDPILKMSF